MEHPIRGKKKSTRNSLKYVDYICRNYQGFCFTRSWTKNIHSSTNSCSLLEIRKHGKIGERDTIGNTWESSNIFLQEHEYGYETWKKHLFPISLLGKVIEILK